MELAGIVRRPGSEAVHGIKTVSDVEELGHVDAALLLSLIHIEMCIRDRFRKGNIPCPPEPRWKW